MKKVIFLLILILVGTVLAACGGAESVVDTAAIDQAVAEAEAAAANAADLEAALAEAEAAAAEAAEAGEEELAAAQAALEAAQADLEAAQAELEAAQVEAEEAQAGEGETTEQAAEDPVVITMVTHETEVLDAEFWLNAIDEVLADLPDNIEVEWSSTADRDAYAKQLAATDQFPDIPFAVTVADFAEASMLTPFDDAYLEENFLMPQAAYVNGKSWAPPVGAQLIPLVFYNKSIFEEVGVEVPTTWDEFLQVNQAIKDAGHIPLLMCGAEPWCASFPAVGLVSQHVFGDDPDWMLKRKAGEVSFSDPEFVAAMQKLQDLNELGYIDEAALGTDFATANQTFYDGGAAMYMQGSWFIGYPPDDMGFEMGAFVLPRPDGKQIASIYVGGGTRVSALSEHPEELMAFAELFEMHPAVMTDIIQNDALFPMMKNMTIDDYDVEMSDLYYDTYNNIVVNDEFPKVAAFTWANNDHDPIPGWKDEFYASIQNILLGDSVEEEMARLDQVWDETAERLSQ
jgi:multiple sugar transport system substrate-binding protein/raffinose/stachyose/melibiose transport system substrate-binding protein